MKKWVLILGICFAGLPTNALAQGCAVCTKTASGLGQETAKGLNKGILYLAFLPITILGTVGYFWWKQGRP